MLGGYQLIDFSKMIINNENLIYQGDLADYYDILENINGKPVVIKMPTVSDSINNMIIGTLGTDYIKTVADNTYITSVTKGSDDFMVCTSLCTFSELDRDYHVTSICIVVRKHSIELKFKIVV